MENMSDPFYINRGEIEYNLGRLTQNLQRLQKQTQLPTSPTSKETEDGEVQFDKVLVQETLKIISELEHQLTDFVDTFARQTTNAKVLGLTMSELSTRKQIVEAHQKSFDGMKEDFAYVIKGEPGANPSSVVAGLYAQRGTSTRRYEEKNKENRGGHDNGTYDFHEPSRESMHEMKQKQFFADHDDDDDDLVEVYHKKATGELTMREGVEFGGKPINVRRGRGAVGEFMDRHFPLTKRRNRIIFFSFPVVLVVIILIIILATTL